MYSSFTLLPVAIHLLRMKTLVVWLVILMAAESSVCEFTDFENGMLWSCILTDRIFPFLSFPFLSL